jgi:hypothetical protein
MLLKAHGMVPTVGEGVRARRNSLDGVTHEIKAVHAPSRIGRKLRHSNPAFANHPYNMHVSERPRDANGNLGLHEISGTQQAGELVEQFMSLTRDDFLPTGDQTAEFAGIQRERFQQSMTKLDAYHGRDPAARTNYGFRLPDGYFLEVGVHDEPDDEPYSENAPMESVRIHVVKRDEVNAHSGNSVFLMYDFCLPDVSISGIGGWVAVQVDGNNTRWLRSGNQQIENVITAVDKLCDQPAAAYPLPSRHWMKDSMPAVPFDFSYLSIEQ